MAKRQGISADATSVAPPGLRVGVDVQVRAPTVWVKDAPTDHRTALPLQLDAVSGNYIADGIGQLQRVGIEPAGRLTYELANGMLHEYTFGLAQIEFMGDITAGRVIFGPEDTEPLLGVTQLESAGIIIDPRTGNLKRLPAIPLKQFAATA